MGAGGYFYFDVDTKLNDFLFKERANFCLVSPEGKCIYVLECNNTLNQVTIVLKSPDEDTFDNLRGPDLIESSIEEFEQNIIAYLDNENKFIQKYFEVSLTSYTSSMILSNIKHRKQRCLMFFTIKPFLMASEIIRLTRCCTGYGF